MNQFINVIKHLAQKRLRKSVEKCQKCRFTTKNKGEMESHVKERHQRRKDRSKKTSNKSVKYVNTAPRSQRNSNLKCPKCSYITSNSDLLRYHNKVEHFEKKNINKHPDEKHISSFDCEFCDFSTEHIKSLRNHVEWKHSKDVEFMCNYCDFVTTTKSIFQVHMNRKHLKRSLK